jgi:hypothetical protein
MTITEGNVNRISALIYTGLSATAALTFLALTLLGDYDWVARIGGAGWVFLLAMIITMPTVTPLLRARARADSGRRSGHHQQA